MQRIRSRAQFQAVMAGSTVARTVHFALHRVAIDSPAGPGGASAPQALFAVHAPWLGVMVPKRWARRAVTRNTIKRQIDAVSQLFEARLPQAAHVVRLRSAFERSRFNSATSDALRVAVRAELLRLFEQACAPAASPAP